MAENTFRILCVHGVGDHHTDSSWQEGWKRPIVESLQRWNPACRPEIDFLLYDDLFQGAPLNAATYAEALSRLGWSGIVHGIGDLFGRTRGLGGLPEVVRWTAGMVAQWAENEKLRIEARKRILEHVNQFDPRVICAHSLGSLLCYDTFLHEEGSAAIEGRVFVSFGSQIGNPFVRATFGGRLVDLTGKYWFHLFNKHDDVLTAKIRIASPKFEQVDAPFDLRGAGDHDATTYLGHPNVVDRVWRELAGGAQSRELSRSVQAFSKAVTKSKRRALLVGINEYPDEQNRLEGCVNDVFLISSVLQESGFSAEDIRVVLDERATAEDIRNRLGWLLEDTAPGDQRVFFYSGHGAQIPGYGIGEKIDRQDECLVPFDFDWSRDRAITDDWFYDLYSQLPYDSYFVAILDCCHSGGMARSGGAKVRGLDPPDDIRHRMLRWDIEHEMWVQRDLTPLNSDLASNKAYTGKSGADRRLGRSVALRTLPNRKYDRVRKELNHHGPYMPVIYQACQEEELSLEYRHGVCSYGAFTYCLARTLRHHRNKGTSPTFQALLDETKSALRELRYDQTPALVGPRNVVAQAIPWTPPSKRRAKR